MEKEKTGKLLAYVIQRLKEPSTWLGLAMFAGFFGLSGERLDVVIQQGPGIVVAIGTLLAIFFPEVGSVLKNRLDDTGILEPKPSEAPFDPLDPAGAGKEP